MANIKNKFTQPLSTEFSPKDLVVDIKNGHLYYKSNLGVHKLIGDNLGTITEAGVWQGGVSNVIYYEGGNVGIGTTTPGEALEVVGNISASNVEVPSGGKIIIDGDSSGAYLDSPAVNQIDISIGDAARANFTNNLFKTSTNNQLGDSIDDYTLIMGHITASGNINASGDIQGSMFISSGSDINEGGHLTLLPKIGGGYIWNVDNYQENLRLFTQGTEVAVRMLIEGATGHVGIGIQNPTSKLHVVDNSGTFGAEVSVVKFQNTSTDNYSSVMELHIGDASHPYSSANMEFIGFHNGAGTRIGRIHGNTGGEDGINIDDTPSDRRLKHDIKESTRLGIDKLMQLRMVDFRYTKAPEKVHTSIIAQECKEVYPDAISDYEEENKEKGLEWGDDGYQPMYVQSNKFIPLLLTAVQDQQKIIEKLEARIEKMENK